MADIDGASFLSGANAGFIADLYARFLDDPGSVDESWRQFFAEIGEAGAVALAELRTPVWEKPPAQPNGNGAAVAAADPAALRQATSDAIRALQLIRAYRVRGHLEADLDPLGLDKRGPYPELDFRSYGFAEADLDREIFLNGIFGHERASLREILALLRRTYCGKIGVEYMHIQVPAERAWIQEKFEKRPLRPALAAAEKKEILDILTTAETFERFLDRRYTGTKRFGIEGAESLMPALEAILRRGSALGVKEFVVGMPHRGRLNVLANFVGKPYAAIFSEFQGNSTNPEHVHGSGDVKYHLGTSADREVGGRTVHLSLAANPSHLEAVNPVVLGKVRAKQQQRGDGARHEVAGILMHGDAAFAGQGLVAESLELSELGGFCTGGTIHVIVNNQIGFTTAPAAARSSPYPSDIAKAVQAPIFHVNGDDPEAVVEVALAAAEYRREFGKDVVVDLFCYRRHGHNEGDEPAFTQPLMYRAIASHPTTRQLYAARLVAQGVVAEGEPEAMAARFAARLEGEFEAAKSYRPNKADWLEGAWAGLGEAPDDDRRGDTAVGIETLRELGRGLAAAPADFRLNPKVARQLDAKRAAIESGDGIDWATAEALAIASLCAEGTHVRMSGQDSGRGTFSHRHAILVDQESEARYVPINHVRAGQAPFEIIDSPLSEAGVVGFEYGYSLADPSTLVLWEAQFGDFANGAQVIVDQFLSAGEAKWLRMSGLVLLLPHGYEGQGPEHSSARIERYLQLCAEDNIQVCNLTSAANYFHALRRQVRRNFRKPLVVLTPKSLLRAKEVASRLDEMGPGSTFHRVVGETGPIAADDQVRRVVLCSGKVYFDLVKARAASGDDHVALVRVEQLYPFPARTLAKLLARWRNAEIVWCQEEPQNMGAWNFVDRRVEVVLAGLDVAARRPRFVGRAEAASPATGLFKRHLEEQGHLVRDALAA
ncbi:MAG TPA: 2-oxoglutarate dehydrogenase E1 component [Stellaceae bacterium]|jgi:2-oxoglutarate dehydrogenase E1 component|nr:2-oxoglutarate dehydrogenase E1 component [Stellaceae bacterium]